MERDLVELQSNFVTQGRRDFDSRRQHAINSAMTLALLPGEVANARANADLVRANVTNVFANIEVQDALVNANLTNMELSGMLAVWDLLGNEQMERDKEFQAEFLNAIRGDQGFSLTDILGLMNNYNNQQQKAYA